MQLPTTSLSLLMFIRTKAIIQRHSVTEYDATAHTISIYRWYRGEKKIRNVSGSLQPTDYTLLLLDAS